MEATGSSRNDYDPVRCPGCGASYRAFRYPDALTWADAYQQLRQAHDQRICDHNDYSHPPRRAAILGKMREAKLLAWKEHVDPCLHYAEDCDQPPGGSPFTVVTAYSNLRRLRLPCTPLPARYYEDTTGDLHVFHAWPVGSLCAQPLPRPLTWAELLQFLGGYLGGLRHRNRVDPKDPLHFFLPSDAPPSLLLSVAWRTP